MASVRRKNGEVDSSNAPRYLTIEERDRLIIQLTKEITDVRIENSSLRIENEQLKKDLQDSLPKESQSPICACGHTAMYHRVVSRGKDTKLGGCIGRECRCASYKPAHT